MNTAPPTLSGIPQVGDTLTASTGTWSGATPMTFMYKWSDGTVAQTDTLSSFDAGGFVTVTVTATNHAGSGSATSQPVGPVTSPPSVGGTGSGSSGSGGFSIQGTRIVAPDGSTFVPVGANMDGQDSWWSAPTAGMCGDHSCVSYAQAWGWNTIRLNTCLPGGCPAAVDGCGSSCDYLQGALPEEISEYTAAHIVTMVERHDYTTGAGSLPTSNPTAYQNLINWWVNLANTYKNNPYVWFNLLNEPLGITAGNPQQEFTSYDDLYGPIIKAIRATGAQNIIVLDGVGSGQDSYDWSCSNRDYQTYSANINAAPGLEAQYGNILPSVHVYNQWGGYNNTCTQQSLEAAFVGYMNAVHNAGVPLIVGETGDQQNCTGTASTYGPGQCQAALVAFDCAHKYGVGLLYWHGQMEMPLVTNGGGFDSINSMTNPTNLSTYNMPGWDQGWGGGKSLWGLGHGQYTSCTS